MRVCSRHRRIIAPACGKDVECKQYQTQYICIITYTTTPMTHKYTHQHELQHLLSVAHNFQRTHQGFKKDL